jgi:hypothetical protein
VIKEEGFEIMVSNKDAERIAIRTKQAHDELEHYRKMINKVLESEANMQEESKDQTLKTAFTTT